MMAVATLHGQHGTNQDTRMHGVKQTGHIADNPFNKLIHPAINYMVEFVIAHLLNRYVLYQRDRVEKNPGTKFPKINSSLRIEMRGRKFHRIVLPINEQTRLFVTETNAMFFRKTILLPVSVKISIPPPPPPIFMGI